MTGPAGFDRTLSEWLDETGAQDIPPRVIDAAIDRARHTRRARPLPDFITRFLPMTTNFAAAPPLARPRPLARLGPVGAFIALTLLALALIGAALLTVGSPAPTGAVQNGLIAYDTDGDIWVVDPDGSDPHPLIVGPTTQAGPVWSPDGQRIAYWERVSGSGDLAIDTDTFLVRVADADGGNDHDVTGGVPYRQVGPYTTAGGIRWSPDSRHVAFAIATPEGRTGPSALTDSLIMVAAADGTGATGLELGVNAEDPSWQPVGDLLVFAVRAPSGPDTAGVWVVGRDGTGARRVVDTVVSADDGYAFTAPLWSPSGQWLVYPCCSGAHDTWVADLAAGDPRQVAPDPVDEYWPAWSPTSDRIAFQRQTDPNAPENDIVVVNADGSDPRTVDVESTGGVGPMVWSPDGTRVLGHTSYSEQLVIAMVDGSEPPVLVPAPKISYVGTGWSWQRRW